MKALINRFSSSQFLLDSFWAVFGNLLTKGLAFVSAIVVARYLEKDAYGEYGLLRNLVINVGVLSTFGLGYTATKFIAEKGDAEQARSIIRSSLRITFFTSVVLAILTFVFAEELATEYFRVPHLAFYLKIVAGWLIMSAITTTQTGIIAGYGLFKRMAVYNVCIGVITFLLTLGGVHWFGFAGSVYALVIAQAVNLILYAYLIRTHRGKAPKITAGLRALYKKLLYYSAPIAIQEIVYSVSSILVYVVLLRNSDTGELGIFTAAMQWSGIVLFIPSILRNVMLKHFASNNSDAAPLRGIVRKSVLLNLLLTAIPVLVLIAGYPLISALYGESFEGMFTPVMLLLVSTVFMSMGTVYNQFFMSVDRNWAMLWMRLGRDSGILVIGYLLIVSGVLSPAGAMAAAYLGANILYFAVLLAMQQLVLNNRKDERGTAGFD